MRKNVSCALFLLASAFGFSQSVAETMLPVSGGHTPGDPAALRGVFLYDQVTTSLPGVIDTFVSQEGAPSEISLHAKGADDFTVPTGIGGWQVSSVRAIGTIFYCIPGPCSVATFNVEFYASSGNAPATSPMFSYTGLAYTTTPFGSLTIFDIAVPSTFLPPGTYWVSIQARNDFCPAGDPTCSFSANGIWGWAEAGNPPGYTTPFGGTNPGHWINPAGGWGTGCTSWGRRELDCNLGGVPPAGPPVAPDYAFALAGTEVTCVITSIYISSPNSVTVTGTPGCVVDIYFSANCGYSTINPADPNVTYVGTVTIGAGGSVTLTTAIPNDVCFYVTFPGGGPVLAVSMRFVPTLSQWMIALMAIALCGMGLILLRRRNRMA